MHYFKWQKLEFKQLFNDMVIDYWSHWNSASMENIQDNVIQRWICQNSHPTKKILSVVTLLKVWIGVSGLKFGLMLVNPLKPNVFNPQSLMSYPTESFHSLLNPKFYKLFFFFGETNLKLNITTLKPTHCHPQNTIISPDHSYVHLSILIFLILFVQCLIFTC